MSTPPRWSAPTKHDPKTCATCGPYFNSPAWKRGEAKAKADRAKLTEGMDREDA